MENLREKETELMAIVKAIDGVLKTKDWQVLTELLWSKEVERIERLILTEAKNPEVNVNEIYKLQGRRDEAKKYADLQEFGKVKVKELEALKQTLK